MHHFLAVSFVFERFFCRHSFATFASIFLFGCRLGALGNIRVTGLEQWRNGVFDHLKTGGANDKVD